MTLDPMLHVLMQQARGDLAAQVMQVRRARSLREVAQHMDPQVSPMLRSVSTRRKLRVSAGSRKLKLRIRQSSSGSAAIRSRVMAPLSRPEAIGE